MKSLTGIFAAVEKEHTRSVEKYGSWNEILEHRQRLAIEGEFREWQQAYDRGDITGPHGEIAELIQVMNVCARRILYLEGSPDA